MASDGSVIIKIDGDDSGFKSVLQGLGSTAKSGGEIAAKAIAGIGTALTTGAAAAVKIGMDFEAAMSNVSAISGATGEDLEALTAKAEEMGATTKFSASEAADALSYMAMAGWKTEDMLNGIDGIMNLAAASGEDLATTSDIVTDALTAFGMTAQESGRLADVMAAASSNANTNVSLLGETFKYVAPVAGALGYSCEDTAVAIGLMANSGIKGSQAGTSLRAIMTRLAKPTDEVAGCMERLGISLTDSAGEILPLSDLVSQLREKFAGLEDAQKTEYAASLAGQEAMSGLLAIVNASDSDFEKLTTAIDNSSGSAKRMADTMNDNLKGRLTELGSAAEGFAIKVYDAMEGPLKDGVEAAIGSIGTLTKEMTDGKLQRSAQKLATGFGNIVETGAELASDVLPDLVDGFAEVLEHGKQIVVMYGAMKTAALGFKAASNLSKIVASFQTAALQLALFTAGQTAAAAETAIANGALTAQEVIVGVVTGKIKLATAAQAAWNAITTANPYVLLGAAIAAVVVGISAYILAQKDEVNQTEDAIKSAQKKREAYKELTASTNEATAAALQSTETADWEIKKFQALTNVSGKVRAGTEEYAEAKALASSINAVYPDAIQELEDEKGAYLEICDSIDLLIAKKKAEKVIDAGSDEYSKTLENIKSYAAERVTLADQIKAKQAELAEAEDKYAQIGSDRWKYACTDIKKDLESLIEEYDNTGDAMQTVQSRADMYSELMAATQTDDLDRINAALSKYQTNLIQATDTNAAACVQQAADALAMSQATSDALGAEADASKQMAQAFGESSTIAADAILQMVNHFIDGKTGAVTNVEEMNSEIVNAMSELKEPLSTEAANAIGASIATMLVETYGAKSVGENFAQGYYDGLFGSLGIADDVAAQLVTDAIEAAKTAQDSHSPSRVMAEEGRNFAEGFAQGISDNATAGDDGATSLVNSALIAAQNALSGVPVIGGLFSSLLGGGITTNGGWVSGAASGVAASAAASASAQSTAFWAAGSALMKSAGSGISGNSKAMSSATQSAAKGAHTAADAVKTQFRVSGTGYMTMMSAAVRSGAGGVKAASSAAASGAASAAKGYSSSFHTAGGNMASGLAAGIRAGASAAISAARNLATSALAAAKAALGIRSPSRVMRDEVGRWIPAGIAVGIEQHTSIVMATMRGIGTRAGKEFNTSVQDELDAMSLKMQGAVEAESASVAQAARASAAEGSVKRLGNQAPRGDINIYQTNNSPKALSQRDIYRQTKRAAKEATAYA